MRSSMKTLFRKGDLVQVISGKEKGKKAKISKVLLKKESVLLEGLNQVKRHQKPSQANPQGGIVSKEAPIHISNVMAVDPNTQKPRVQVLKSNLIGVGFRENLSLE